MKQVNDAIQVVDRIYDNARCAVGDVLNIMYKHKRVRCTIFLADGSHASPWYVATMKVLNVHLARGGNTPTFTVSEIELLPEYDGRDVSFLRNDRIRNVTLHPNMSITVVDDKEVL